MNCTWESLCLARFRWLLTLLRTSDSQPYLLYANYLWRTGNVHHPLPAVRPSVRPFVCPLRHLVPIQLDAPVSLSQAENCLVLECLVRCRISRLRLLADMSTSKRNLMSNEWEMSTIERKYSVPPGGPQPPATPPHHVGELQAARGERGSTSEDLHAWSIYRWELWGWQRQTFFNMSTVSNLKKKEFGAGAKTEDLKLRSHIHEFKKRNQMGPQKYDQ